MKVAQIYTTQQARARFTEIIRKVQAGQRIVISYRGREVAEIRSLLVRPRILADRLARLEREGVLGSPTSPAGALRPIARRPGALARFLKSRE